MDLITFFTAILPAFLVGLIAFVFFRFFFKEQDKIRFHEIRAKNRKERISYLLQASERLTLFLERISPQQLLLRVSPVGQEKEAYEMLLNRTIAQEFDHNITQQLHVSDNCWKAIVAAKNTIQQQITEMSKSESIENAQQLREALLNYYIKHPIPTEVGLSFIKQELKKEL